MSKIYFDYENIQRSIEPALDGAINEISNAKRVINNSYIPSDCIYKDYLSDLSSQFNVILNKIKRVKNWSIKTNSCFENSQNDVENFINNIEVIEIAKK